MKKALFFVFCLLLSGFVAGQQTPNIIVIFTDDQGYADLGAQDILHDIETPHIDQMAAEGVRMTAGYVTAPQCVPSRAGLLAGRYQQKFGVDHNGTIPMPLDEVLLPERMSAAGYITGMAGKWHLDPNHAQQPWIREHLPDIAHKSKFEPSDIPLARKMPYFPSSRGFDEYFYGAINRYWANYDLKGDNIPPQWIQQEGYRLDIQTEAALAFIQRNKDKPFFFYLPYFAPHVPMEASQKYLRRFPGDMPERRRYCLAMMSAIDDGVGRIRATLQANGLLENTLIFFISDNGAPLKIDKKDLPISYKKGAWDGSLNTPLNGEKGMITEGGVRVPYIVSWPAGLPAGKVYERPVSSLDVAATSIAVAGLPPVEQLDGVNLIPYLDGEKETDPHPALYWRFWQQAAIRAGDFKYLSAGGREYLFDLSQSAAESENVLDQYPEKAQLLRRQLAQWCEGLQRAGIPEGALGESEKAWFDYYLPTTK
jgi:arylsulfatase A-like enzyme